MSVFAKIRFFLNGFSMQRYLTGFALLCMLSVLWPGISRAATLTDAMPYFTDFPSNVDAMSIRLRNVTATGVSIIGQSYTGGSQAYYWNKQDGVTYLGFLDGGSTYSDPLAISADGSTIVGLALPSSNYGRAFRWTRDDGMVDLGVLSGGLTSSATAVSADGSVVAGYSVFSGNIMKSFRWTEDTGMVDIGSLGGDNTQAAAISANGQVIVGSANYSAGVSGRAFRWTESTGIVALSSDISAATAVNADGSVVVGNLIRSDFSGYDAFRWTQNGGLASLGTLSGGTSAMSSYVSADGSIVMGHANNATGTHVFRWTQVDGMLSLTDALIKHGADMGSWDLADSSQLPFAATDDGKLVIGMGKYNGNLSYYLANFATGGITTPQDLGNSLQTIQQSGQQVAAVTRNYAPNGLFIAQNMQQIAVPAISTSGAYGGQMSGSADAFANLSPAAGGKAPSRLSAFLLGSVGIGHNNTSGNYQLNGTLGINMQISDSWNIGAGMISGRTRTDLNFNGDSRLDALGGMAMASYVPYESPLRLYGTAFAADINLDNKRGYLSGSGLDYSRGDTGGFSYGAALRIGWEKKLFSNQTTMMPYLEGRYSKTRIDGYSEKGGTFASSFSDQEDDYTASRLGVEFKHQLNEKTEVLFRPTWGHRFGGNGDGFTATTSGLTTGYAGQAGDRDWAEASVGGSYRATEKLTFTTEVTARSGNTSEPQVSVTIGAFMKF